MKNRLTRRLVAAAFGLALSACGGDFDHLVPLPPTNVAPVASAGLAQGVFVDTQVALDGSGSTDANADSLTYAWTVTTQPLGSSVALSSATAVKPTFTADAAGTYVFTLVVNDGTVDSPAATVTITAAVDEVAPVANAGAAQSVFTGAAVTLDGSASSDANGDTLTYAWTLTPPAGSSAVLTGATTAAPQFTPDVAGAYVASLVVDDGQMSSAASTVTITAAVANVPPVANAGAAQNAARGVTVTLDGSASSDANGDALSYNWSFTSVPAGSAAALSAPNVVGPTFVPDLAGVYVAQLIVNDGQVNSTPVTVTITAADTAPVANAGPVQTAARGTLVTLDGSASSDVDQDALTYTWSFVSVPSGSAAVLSATNVIHPTFTPDVSGPYVVQLVVNDGQLDSAATTVTITATPIVTTTELIVNGSFESGLASWLQGTVLESAGAAGACSYNAATAPGTETLTGAAGFPATDGTRIALGSIASTANVDVSCTLYQTVHVPAGTTSLTLTLDIAVKNASDSCGSTGMFIMTVAPGSIPGLGNGTIVTPPFCFSPAGSSLTHMTVALAAGSSAAHDLNVGIVNGAIGTSHEVVGIDNVHLSATSSN